jgi:polyhydroxyalkanoate synthase subunit PhaC
MAGNAGSDTRSSAGINLNEQANAVTAWLNDWQQLWGIAGAQYVNAGAQYVNGMQPGMQQNAPLPYDKRFAHIAWQAPHHKLVKDVYLLNAKHARAWLEAQPLEAEARTRAKFALEQFIDAASPANFIATNAEALALFQETKGASLQAGLQNFLKDAQAQKISQTDESAFEVGRNMAVSQGAVVYRNALIELIQYTPSTPKVHARPMLMVPPCINKYYILDLQPENSMIKFLVDSGITVFIVSWKNPQADLGHLGWDDYLRLGPIDAIAQVQTITKQKKINALGFCVGGTILSSALAVRRAQGHDDVESMTLLTALLDFTEVGQLGVFIDDNMCAMREAQMGQGGLLAGKELATTFSFLRPNDLVWNYVVSNYLKGQSPPAFDLLYWNGDSTNLPGPMYTWYLRNLYLNNDLKRAKLTGLGQPINLKKVTAPVYVFAAREDHIVPWKTAYESVNILGGENRFVLGASGHIAGTVNPASKNKRSFWANTGKATKAGQTADAWLASASEQPGSWWNDWIAWLKPKSGALQVAPKTLGDAQHKPIMPAPGSYVKEKA